MILNTSFANVAATQFHHVFVWSVIVSFILAVIVILHIWLFNFNKRRNIPCKLNYPMVVLSFTLIASLSATLLYSNYLFCEGQKPLTEELQKNIKTQFPLMIQHGEFTKEVKNKLKAAHEQINQDGKITTLELNELNKLMDEINK